MKRGFHRWAAFNAVGAIGIGVQLAVLAGLTGLLELEYLVSTALAVEASVLHNFLWHQYWTWGDRRSCSRREVFLRFLRFNCSNGVLSITGNVLVMRLLVGTLGMNYLLANLFAIAACSIANFLASDRYVFRRGAASIRVSSPRFGLGAAMPDQRRENR